MKRKYFYKTQDNKHIFMFYHKFDRKDLIEITEQEFYSIQSTRFKFNAK